MRGLGYAHVKKGAQNIVLELPMGFLIFNLLVLLARRKPEAPLDPAELQVLESTLGPCPNASNPHHQCTTFCNKIRTQQPQPQEQPPL